ncbi:uncharacterized protein LOC132612101 [Lycium barbarum]|uniref:uncharacterized protein LOC132612101 n=1 Tax=Lycium barbarum TaxID=112863 RepID=UPI00293F6BE2|nr:uncharacterized protein LOC132612101 [Lycium barbarum]
MSSSLNKDDRINKRAEEEKSDTQIDQTHVSNTEEDVVSSKNQEKECQQQKQLQEVEEGEILSPIVESTPGLPSYIKNHKGIDLIVELNCDPSSKGEEIKGTQKEEKRQEKEGINSQIVSTKSMDTQQTKQKKKQMGEGNLQAVSEESKTTNKEIYDTSQSHGKVLVKNTRRRSKTKKTIKEKGKDIKKKSAARSKEKLQRQSAPPPNIIHD